MLDPETEAAWLLRDADSRCPPGAQALVRHHLGRDAIIRLRGLVGADAAFTLVNGSPKIAIRRGLSPERERWALLHELAEWHLAKLGYEEEDVEDAAEAIAAALVAPREAYRDALAVHGRRFRHLAREFLTTQTAVALRLGEVTGTPVVVIAPARVRVRGDEWAWPVDVSSLAKARRLPQEVKRVSLTDDPRRRVLFAG